MATAHGETPIGRALAIVSLSQFVQLFGELLFSMFRAVTPFRLSYQTFSLIDLLEHFVTELNEIQESFQRGRAISPSLRGFGKSRYRFGNQRRIEGAADGVG